MNEYKDLFLFAAKAGALEGYLYNREKVELLDDWVSNIEKMYANLPESVKGGIRDEFGSVLKKALTYGGKILEEDIRARLNNLLLAL